MRKFIFALILAISVFGLLLLPSNAYAQSIQSTELPQSTQFTKPPTRVRKNIYTPEGQKDLQTLKDALTLMRERGCLDPASWYFQGAIHWIPDPTTYPQGNPLCPGYTSATASTPEVTQLLQNFWQKCPHEENVNIYHFLPWHRLYLSFFEIAVRNITGKDDFAIPYWDYTDNGSSENSIIPNAFRSPADVTNSLYEPLRRRILNSGSSISAADANDPTPVANQITQETLIEGKQQAYQAIRFRDFSSPLENSPHGLMHVELGGVYRSRTFNPITQTETNRGLMTSVPTAGFDPIFWVHHTNIDRIWESWTRQREKDNPAATDIRVTAEELNSVPWVYNFYNGSTAISFQPSEVVSEVYKPSYNNSIYDKLDEVPPSRRAQNRSRDRFILPVEDTIVTSEEVKTKLTDKLTTVNIPLSTPIEISEDVVERGAPSGNENYELEVQVSFQGEPTGAYDVYLNLPNTEATVDTLDKNAHFVGVINFFEVPSSERVTKTVLFDITDKLIEQVKRREQPSEIQNLKVSFLAKNASTAEDIIVERVLLRKFG
ncbi:tyrosinase family protein [Scytonema sp. PCC 10023]|uniref:tyrosinase family protein n=1 Tax=Scytonema sp. PCC 10023 TaxID=1680591 RepID=UPI0039C68EFB